MQISRCFVNCTTLGWALTLCAALPAQEPQRPGAAELRSALAKLAQAFNRHDAAAVAGHWMADGVYVDVGLAAPLAGREAIAAHYAALFQAEPNLKLEAKLSEIEISDKGRALVRGTAHVSGGPSEGVDTSFVAELQLDQGAWRLASVEEADPDPMNELAWLVGNWEDEGTDGQVTSKVIWNSTGRFLIRTYVIAGEDGQTRRGTQYIAWDAGQGALRSWAFNSDGAIAEANWTAHEDHWAIHWTATLGDGRAASATQLIKPVDLDSFQVRWTDLDVDGQLRPSTAWVNVRRVVPAGAEGDGRE